MNKEKLLSKLRAAHSDGDTKGFNAFDFIHAFGSGREALLYSQLFWPEFTEFKGMIFLQQTIETEDDKLKIEQTFECYERDSLRTEQNFNTVEIPSLFGRRIGETDDEEDRLLAEILAKTWDSRLKILFPTRQFAMKILNPEETGGEVAILFYQINRSQRKITDYKYDWGQEVYVDTTAPSNFRPGQLGSICGMREINEHALYLVEFSDGEAIEIPENLMESLKTK